MGFKEDARFARYVTMGVVGAAAIAHDLRDRFGHRLVELERYSMANKVWREKVKRLRIPGGLFRTPSAGISPPALGQVKGPLAILMTEF